MTERVFLRVDCVALAREVQEVKGDFEKAVRQLIADLVEGNKSNSDILYRWDTTRGDDWVIATRKNPQNLRVKGRGGNVNRPRAREASST